MNKLSPANALGTVLALFLFLLAVPAQADFRPANTSINPKNSWIRGNLTVTGTTTNTGAVTNSGNLTVGGNLAVTGTTALTGVATFTAKPTLSTATIGASGDTYTIPDVGDASFVMTAGAQTIGGVKTLSSSPVLSTATLTANGDTITIQDLGDANFVQSEGTQTINGAKTFSTAPTITGGLPAAQIQTGSAKRQVMRVQLSPVTGAAADSTTYAGLAAFGRAGTVKRISLVCHVALTAGTDTIEILKNGTTTQLDAATFDANTLVADVVTNATLTATGADLALAATDVVRCKYNAGSQTVDAEDVTAIIEFEPTDF